MNTLKNPRRLCILFLILAMSTLGTWKLFFSGPDFSHVRNLDSQGTTIIALGDSLTAGAGIVPLSNTWPEVISQNIEYPVINAGKDGDTTIDALSRLDKDVLSKDPWIVIILLGGNDFLQHVPKEQTFANLAQIIQKIQKRGAIVMILGLRLGFTRDEYEAGFEALAKQYGTIYIKHINSGILTNASLKADRIHPNDAGHRLMAERIEKALSPLIQESLTRRP